MLSCFLQLSTPQTDASLTDVIHHCICCHPHLHVPVPFLSVVGFFEAHSFHYVSFTFSSITWLSVKGWWWDWWLISVTRNTGLWPQHCHKLDRKKKKVQWQWLAFSEEIPEVILDEHMDLLRALEMSRLQYLRDAGLLHEPDGQKWVQFSSVQFKMVSACSKTTTYALHPISQKFPQRHFWNRSSVCLMWRWPSLILSRKII